MYSIKFITKKDCSKLRVTNRLDAVRNIISTSVLLNYRKTNTSSTDQENLNKENTYSNLLFAFQSQTAQI